MSSSSKPVMPDFDVESRFDVGAFQTALQTRFVGRSFVYMRETESTMVDAEQAADRGAATGALFMAERQSKGQGRCGRDWASADNGNLYCTLVLRPKSWEAAVAVNLGLPLAIAQATQASLSEFGVHAPSTSEGSDQPCAPLSERTVGVKWPNDVWVGTRKLCGIKVDCSSSSKGMCLRAGFGVNVHERMGRNSDREVARLAVSLDDCGVLLSATQQNTAQHEAKHGTAVVGGEDGASEHHSSLLAGVGGQDTLLRAGSTQKDATEREPARRGDTESKSSGSESNDDKQHTARGVVDVLWKRTQQRGLREHFLADVCNRLEALLSLKLDAVLKEYAKWDVLANRPIIVMPKKREKPSAYYRAVAVGLSKSGQLMVRRCSDQDPEGKQSQPQTLISEEVSVRTHLPDVQTSPDTLKQSQL